MKQKLNKRGASAIEMIIGFMIIIMMLSFLLDILNILSKYSVVSQVSTDVARITGIQGGVLSAAPTGWPGGASNYVTLAQLEGIIDQKFAAAGMSQSDWQIKLYDTTLTKNGSLGKGTDATVSMDYLTNYTVEVQATYTWSVVSNFLPGSITQTLVSRRPATSEWKYNYDNWIGE